MNYEQALGALPYVCGGFAILCLGIGYVAGSKRTFASLGYGSESIGECLRTLLPWYGEPGWLRKRRQNVQQQR